MDQRALLRKTIALAKTGDIDAFENLYILTVGDTYAKIRSAVRDKRDAENVLVDTYVRLYKYAHELPLDAEALEQKIELIIAKILYKRFGIEIEELYVDEEFPELSEDRAATILLWIGDKAGFAREPQPRVKNSAFSDVLNAGKIVMTVIILAVTVFVAYKGWDLIIRKDKAEAADVTAAETETAVDISSEAALVIEEERLTPGWRPNNDGDLYYVMKEGKLADHVLSLGKQLLTFSTDGVLTLIGSNGAVSENPNLSFDEDIRYEVKNGDIYQKDMKVNGQETAVTKNGHVVQADARAGYLWYICKYQVPNSNQIKTTIYCSDLDGKNEEEIYTTDNTLNTEQFQFTKDWMYYISEGMLLRRNLETGSVELMAQNIEHYFAWENTAYYMRDRTLERVSEGVDYSGIEAGYRIEHRNEGFVLLDMLGEPVKPDEKGEKQAGDRIYSIVDGVIASVRPAAREVNGVVYFIDTAGSDKKIYSKNSTGTQTLIRQDGLVADSLCIAGEWLYYSARIENYGAETASQIFRLNLETLESEAVGNGFEGYMRNMYFFNDLQGIFAEYIPSAEDPENVQGMIGYIPIGGEPRSLNDSAALPSSGGAYMLELVNADAKQAYCLYHTYSYNAETGEVAWTSSIPMEIVYQ